MAMKWATGNCQACRDYYKTKETGTLTRYGWLRFDSTWNPANLDALYGTLGTFSDYLETADIIVAAKYDENTHVWSNLAKDCNLAVNDLVFASGVSNRLYRCITAHDATGTSSLDSSKFMQYDGHRIVPRALRTDTETRYEVWEEKTRMTFNSSDVWSITTTFTMSKTTGAVAESWGTYPNGSTTYGATIGAVPSESTVDVDWHEDTGLWYKEYVFNAGADPPITGDVPVEDGDPPAVAWYYRTKTYRIAGAHGMSVKPHPAMVFPNRADSDGAGGTAYSVLCDGIANTITDEGGGDARIVVQATPGAIEKATVYDSTSVTATKLDFKWKSDESIVLYQDIEVTWEWEVADPGWKNPNISASVNTVARAYCYQSAEVKTSFDISTEVASAAQTDYDAASWGAAVLYPAPTSFNTRYELDSCKTETWGYGSGLGCLYGQDVGRTVVYTGKQFYLLRRHWRVTQEFNLQNTLIGSESETEVPFSSIPACDHYLEIAAPGGHLKVTIDCRIDT